MYIRQTKTNNSATGEAYYSHRLVHSVRINGKVRQQTLLNLGRNLPIKQDDWPLLCTRIEQLLQAQEALLPLDCPTNIERAAQRYAGQLIKRAKTCEVTDNSQEIDNKTNTPPTDIADIHAVDVNSLTLSQPRSIGVEHAALHALSQLELPKKLTELGFNGVQRAAVFGNIIGRMAEPASELATWRWLQDQSALGELIDVDFESLSHMTLYRGSDLLIQHRQAIEKHIFSTAQTLFGFEQTITLYDLTNTFFEGKASGNAQAKHGRSKATAPAHAPYLRPVGKEKRSDCPLVTLGLVLDSSGFIQHSKCFAGNVSEGNTLSEMLNELDAQSGALVVMDAGIATQANIDWLANQGYRYLVVKRGGKRVFDSEQALAIESASGDTIRLYKTLNEEGTETYLHCHSETREAKEIAMQNSFMERFEAGLQKIADNLKKPRGEKKHNKLLERIGKLKQKSQGASQHYTLNIETDESGKKVTAITWEKMPVEGTQNTHPGVYCLRTNELSWDEEKLWRTYTMLTDIESVFRSLKSELGLRPVFHSTENRVEGHLFITVLAYQCVQVIRTTLKQAGINDSWSQLRKILAVQQRVTSSMRRQDGGAVHIRKSTTAEPMLRKVYDVLGIHAAPGGIQKMIS